MEPILLPSNQPAARFYRGGRGISQFRGEAESPPNTPEDWIASTTSVRADAPVGMTRLPDGRLLSDAIEEAPLDWLGPAHVESYGVDTMLLVKLLDAGQRLPIHAHPDGGFARRHLSRAHGKAEAWYLLAPGVVHLGLTRSLEPEELRDLVERQDSATLLSLMHEVPVAAGDSVFVPHGVLHAIGAGVLLAEVQEPEDLSILLEWNGFDLDGATHGHLDLGFETALAAVESRARSAAEIAALVRRGVTEGNVLPGEADAYFRLDRVQGRRDFEAGFTVVIALDGGTTTLVPYAAGPVRVEGDALVARPPLPHAASGGVSPSAPAGA